jgi:hypothetical protein
MIKDYTEKIKRYFKSRYFILNYVHDFDFV